MSRKSTQTTLFGEFVPTFPKVRTSRGYLLDWDRNRIVRQIVEETRLVEVFYGYKGADEETAKEIARLVEKKIQMLGLQSLSGPLIREIVNMTLLERGLIPYRNVCTRVGTPVFDAHLIDVGRGFEAHDNANLQENAETSHKKKADKISKEQYLLQLPPDLADHHLQGDLHIHDLEYFGTRPFCQDWDLRYFFYYGLMPDGNGTKASVAGPAKRAEVAVLHAVKALGSAQTNFAGGQGYYNFLTFLAPYFEGMDYDGIKQLMQMFVYEMTQMMVARGGQVVFSSVQLSPGVPTLWKDKPCVFRGKVWDGNQAPLRTYGEFEREVRLLFKALMEVMLDGDYWGKPFSFPKPEISIEPDFLTEDEEFNRSHPDLPTYHDLYLMTFELASKYGTPYYDNQIPAYRGAGEGISCYQCLAGDELVPVADREGRISVKRIQDIFDTAAKNGRRIDTFGTELAYYDGRTPSVDFETLEASLRPFHGVMRRRYSGPLLHITLESGRAITVTPDHPVYVLDGDVFVRDVAGELNVGDCLPVLKTTGFCERAVEEIEVAETLDTAGYGDSIRVTWDGVTLRTSGRISLPRVLPASSELARLLGYYLAAGRSERSARRYTVRFTFEEGDAEIAADTAACIRAVLGVEPQVLETASGTAVIISSRLIYLLFAALGCGSADADKSVPDLVFNLDRSLVADYLGAVFNTTGKKDSGRPARSIRLNVASREVAQKLVWLSGRIGVQMSYAERDRLFGLPPDRAPHRVYTCRITDNDQIERFQAATGYPPTMARGRENGCPFAQTPENAATPGCTGLACASRYGGDGVEKVQVTIVIPPLAGEEEEDLAGLLEYGDVHPLRIRSIEPVDDECYVYDLVDVAGTHTFANALGVVTGNCCAYQFSSLADEDDEFEDKLYFREGKHFSMGSWQVMSINCPRAAYKAEGDQERLFAELKSLMDTAVDLFRIKRRWMSLIRASGRMPFAMQRPKDPNTGERGAVAVDLEGLVYTIGVVGVNEMVQHFTGYQLHESKEAFRLAVRAMTELEIYARELSKKHNMTIALARTPAETTGQRFAVADLLDERFRDHAIRVVKGDAEQALDMLGTTLDLPIYYTNGTHVTPGAAVPLTKRIEIEHVFFPIVDGGNIFHIWLGEARPDPRGLMEVAMNLCRTTQIGYFAFTRDLTVSLKEFHEYRPVRSGQTAERPVTITEVDRADA